MSLAKPFIAALAVVAALGVFVGHEMPPIFVASPLMSSVAAADQRPRARLLQEVTSTPPVSAPAPALEVATAAPAAEVGAPVPGPAGEQVSASEALFKAIADRDIPALESLFAAGASTDVYNTRGETPLIFAMRQNDPEVINAILTKGVDTNLPERPSGITPLMLAIQQNNLALATRLLNAGADINLKDTLGDTALIMAVKQGNYGAVQLLVSRRPSPTTSAPDFTATDASGRTAQDIANENGDPRMIALFQNIGGPAAEPAPEMPSTAATTTGGTAGGTAGTVAPTGPTLGQVLGGSP